MFATRRLHSYLSYSLVIACWKCIFLVSMLSFTLSRSTYSVVFHAVFHWQNDVILLLATVQFPSLKRVWTKSVFVLLFCRPKCYLARVVTSSDSAALRHSGYLLSFDWQFVFTRLILQVCVCVCVPVQAYSGVIFALTLCTCWGTCLCGRSHHNLCRRSLCEVLTFKPRGGRSQCWWASICIDNVVKLELWTKVLLINCCWTRKWNVVLVVIRFSIP